MGQYSFAQTCLMKADTPAHLLQTIRFLAAQKQYEALKKHIYPLDARTFPDGPLNVQLALIEGIKQNKSKQDFAYSDAALSHLLNTYMAKFRALTKEEIGKLDKEILHYDPKLQAVAKKSPQAFLLFDEQVNQVCGPGVTVLLVKIDNEFKLLFWDELNCVLPEKDQAR